MKHLKPTTLLAAAAAIIGLLLVLSGCEHGATQLPADNPNIITLTQGNFREQVLQSTQPVLVDYWAVWCGPCKILAPTINEIASEYAGRVKVGKVNVDHHQSLVDAYSVEGFPTVLLFKDGKVAERMLGVVGKKELQEKLNKLLPPTTGTPAK